MPIPWLRLLDMAIGVTDIARSRRAGRGSDSDEAPLARRTAGAFETLGSVIVAALKEAFDRDARQIELERERFEAERERAERAQRLEIARQAGEREIGRLKFIAGVAVAGGIAELVALRLVAGGMSSRVVAVSSLLLLVGALAASLAGQTSAASWIARGDELPQWREVRLSGAAGASASWLLVIGLALAVLAVVL